MNANANTLFISLSNTSLEHGTAIAHAVWSALEKKRTVTVSLGFVEVTYFGKEEKEAEIPIEGDLYVCALLAENVIVSARVVSGSPAHARAVKAAKKFWPNHVIDALTFSEIEALEKAGKKILTTGALPSV